MTVGGLAPQVVQESVMVDFVFFFFFFFLVEMRQVEEVSWDDWCFTDGGVLVISVEYLVRESERR